MSPVERTLEWLREHGYEAQKVEYFNWYAKRRVDLFGFIDILAVSEHHLLAIQCSDDSHHAEHRKVILNSPVARLLVYHMDIWILSWGLRLTGKRRKDGLLNRKKEWSLRITEFKLINGRLKTYEMETGAVPAIQSSI